MTTPDTPDSPQVAAGWRANDLHPDDVAHLLERFISRFEPGSPDECWYWTGSLSPTGYGWLHCRYPQAFVLAHRLSWVAFNGTPLVGNITIDHLCNNKTCVNPDHLEPVTLFENVRRKSERLGYVIGGKTRSRVGDPARPRRPLTEQQQERARANALAYYYANRERILAERRGPRPSPAVTCEHCAKEIRQDGIRRHIRRMHGEAA
jgi:hypothetical protein